MTAFETPELFIALGLSIGLVIDISTNLITTHLAKTEMLHEGWNR